MSDVYNQDDHVKEVYARFGLALYFAQVLEHGLVNALVAVDLIPKQRHTAQTRDEWGRMVDSFMGRHFEATMGRLMRELRDVATVPSDLDGLLMNALRRRNWLAHDFFRDRAEAFLTRTGRDEMLQELAESKAVFREADERLDATIKPLRERVGLTDVALAKAYDEMLASIPPDG